ncbi:dihydrolipoamide acetyltransferase family protein [Herbiconiux flava]|uniref:Dihydrolipoamide acetyltransferase component of pyruvate dehydrogenase complex n=1 Tax=Herbiconiux flava TaxID=881268 RepID=A0A852SLX0_9MICO|nr:dihydrolipoamide acetyltransferase family protein [Herbiconiux flava]NYD69569.1 pyruvate dehydrogenase E2 component (dihydrolipoamide acetyltransferase) [Herbiconiux flava]GLK16314.1 dihydrolipoamide acetyltransferase component of pyruvate dehydrogenase complex [Herbiconiux flava]
MSSQFNLPDVGEGLTEAEIVSWKVAPGDTVTVNQVIVEIETAKSLVELPSPFAGTVESVLVEEGTTVEVGTPIITVSSGAAAPAGSAAPVQDAPPAPIRVVPSADLTETESMVATAERTATAERPGAEEKPGAVLVGYGIKGHVASRRSSRRSTSAIPAIGETPEGARPAERVARVQQPIPGLPVIAKPPIRKLAKDLGVDLNEVTPTGLIGDVTRDDVIRHAEQAKVFHNIETPQWAPEREERIPVKGMRKQIAKAMVASAFTAPHVSLFVDVDATRTMDYVKRLKASADFTGVKISPLLIMAKAIIWAVQRNPMVNSAFTEKEIIVRNYVNLGIAAATPRGLIVPNIKDAQDMSMRTLAESLEQLTLTAREGRTSPADMADGTITITNIGVFGMDTGTPILNPGEVGIVALGTIKQRPWVVDGEVRPRFVTTVGASFDHRVVDGDVASRFVADVASILEEPALLLD